MSAVKGSTGAKRHQNISDLTESELFRLRESDRARDGEDELVRRYSRLVRAIARPYFLAGADGEDLLQEGLLGLVKAVREYDENKRTAFLPYAETCIKNHIYSAIRNSRRLKHVPLNDYVCIGDSLFDASGQSIAAQGQDPEAHLIAKEAITELEDAIPGLLSKFEAKVLELYLDGFKYSEMADAMGKPAKSLDNAIQRIRRKLARYLGHGDFR